MWLPKRWQRNPQDWFHDLWLQRQFLAKTVVKSGHCKQCFKKYCSQWYQWVRWSSDPYFPQAILFSLFSFIHHSLQGILRQEWPGSLIPWPLNGYWVVSTCGSPCRITNTHTHMAWNHSNLLASKWLHLTAWTHGSICRTLDEFKAFETPCVCACMCRRPYRYRKLLSYYFKATFKIFKATYI